MRTLKILVVAANPVVRAGLTVLLGACPDMEVVGEGAGADLVVVDGDAEAVERLSALAPVLLLTHEPVGDGAFGAAAGRLVHGRFDVAELVRTVRATAHAGVRSTLGNILHFRNPASRVQRFGLSAREVEVMDLIATGLTNQQIATTCSISEKTVKNHINRIFAKLHSTTRGEAIASWLGTRTAS
ncbi:response regulator transcription factor [Streptomyces fradiae]|uniref:response regulator transcription factor n=1 Tax=Streptomyces fradiae TaxID=1906 RepID=UPI0035142D67